MLVVQSILNFSAIQKGKHSFKNHYFWRWLLLGVLAPGATKPNDANVYNEEGWICYVAVVEEGLRRKLWRKGSRM